MKETEDTLYKGKKLKDMNREELIEAFLNMAHLYTNLLNTCSK